MYAKSCIFFIFTLSACTIGRSEVVCPLQFSLVGDQCLRVVWSQGAWEDKTWSQAQVECKYLGGSLAQLQDTSHVIPHISRDLGKGDWEFWVGAQWQNEEMGFQWITIGNEVSNWDDGQPDNGGIKVFDHSDERCVELRAWNGKYNDQDCDKKRSFVCEFDRCIGIKCINGNCESGACRCHQGWSGTRCDQQGRFEKLKKAIDIDPEILHSMSTISVENNVNLTTFTKSISINPEELLPISTTPMEENFYLTTSKKSIDINTEKLLPISTTSMEENIYLITSIPTTSMEENVILTTPIPTTSNMENIFLTTSIHTGTVAPNSKKLTIIDLISSISTTSIVLIVVVIVLLLALISSVVIKRKQSTHIITEENIYDEPQSFISQGASFQVSPFHNSANNQLYNYPELHQAPDLPDSPQYPLTDQIRCNIYGRGPGDIPSCHQWSSQYIRMTENSGQEDIQLYHQHSGQYITMTKNMGNGKNQPGHQQKSQYITMTKNMGQEDNQHLHQQRSQYISMNKNMEQENIASSLQHQDQYIIRTKHMEQGGITQNHRKHVSI
ncbi:unnamed protein product, partial [Meganyctiphanes norvegica]